MNIYEHPNPDGLRPEGRIEAIVDNIDPAKVEDQRFGQFLINVLRVNRINPEMMWHIEDAAWADMLASYPEPAIGS